MAKGKTNPILIAGQLVLFDSAKPIVVIGMHGCTKLFSTYFSVNVIV